jgi:hypothetical protein
MTLVSELHFLSGGTCRRNIEPQGDPKQFGEGKLYFANCEISKNRDPLKLVNRGHSNY